MADYDYIVIAMYDRVRCRYGLEAWISVSYIFPLSDVLDSLVLDLDNSIDSTPAVFLFTCRDANLGCLHYIWCRICDIYKSCEVEQFSVI